MGNCFSCFKVPPPLSAPNDTSDGINKEDMPEQEQYIKTTSSSSAPTSQGFCQNSNTLTYLSVHTNGNASSHQQKYCSSAVTSSVVSTNSSVGKHFYCRRSATRSIQTMGQGDSKHSSDTKLNQLFDNYKDSNEDSILAEGIEKLCEDLQMSPDEFRILIFAWKLNAEQMCRFGREEFVQGCKNMKVDSIKSIQTRLSEIVIDLERDAELFKDLYRFTFRFGLDVAAGERILPSDMAICLWRLVFSIREPPILQRWLQFLTAHPHGIPRDTWNMFLNFSEAVGDDLSSYDDTEAWPSLFDDFVEYENDQMNQNISKDKERDEKNVIKISD